MLDRPHKTNWRKWGLGSLIDFDQSGDGVYASATSNPINATLTTNPYGYAKAVDVAMQGIGISQYPLLEMRKLGKEIANFYGLAANEVLLGAGIDGLIAEVIRGLFSEGDHLVMPTVTFPNAAFITRICGGTVDFAPQMNETFIDLQAMAALQNETVKATYIANPNNPTGEIVSPSDLIDGLYRENCILIVDEANIEFGGESCINHFRDYPNMIVLRTFSKGYGLAGLRVGYACGNPELLRLIDRSRPPFPITSNASAAARAALADQAHLEASVTYVKTERNRLVDALKSRGFTICNGSANSILCRRFDDEKLVDTFDAAGITVADGKVFGLPSKWCRIAPQKVEENDKMIQIIENI